MKEQIQKRKEDLQLARDYVEALTGSPRTVMCFTALQEKGEKKAKRTQVPVEKKSPVELSGTIDECFAELKHLNSKGYFPCVTVNEGTFPRCAENISDIRAVFIDDDSHQELTFKLKPSFIVQSGRGNHYYWLLNEKISKEQFTRLQKFLAMKFETDKKISDPARLMRLPGFIHRKDPSDPILVKVVESNKLRYSFEELFNMATEGLSNPKESTPEGRKNTGMSSHLDKWCSELPTESSTENQFSGRNNTAVILVRELLAHNVDRQQIEVELTKYCERSSLPLEEVEDLVTRQEEKHKKSPFKPFVTSNEESPITSLIESFLYSKGFTHNDVPLLSYWRGSFYRYTETHYSQIETSDLEASLINFLRMQSSLGKRSVRNVTSEIMLQLKGVRPISSATEPGTHLKSPQSGYVICTKNQTLLINRNGKIKLASNDPDLFTLACLNTYYNPEVQCPEWESVMKEILPNEAIPLLQEWFGLNLIYTTSFSKFLLLVGDGANGKSLVLTVLETLLGKDNVSSIPSEAFNSEKTYAIASTIGKLANISDEMGGLKAGGESTLKQFVSGTSMTVEQKYKPSFRASPTARVTFASNFLPRFSDKSDGLWRRMILVPMQFQILDESKQDRRLIDPKHWEDSGELPGILNWSIQGLQRLLKRGRFEIPQNCQFAKDSFRRDSDHLSDFIEDVGLEEAKENEIAVPLLYREYKLFCDQYGHRPIGAAEFNRSLESRFKTLSRTPNPKKVGDGLRARVWIGIKMAKQVSM